MDCPACANPLHMVRIEDVHYHCCRTCHGIWTDAYLLETIVHHAAPRGLPLQRARNSAAHPAHMHVGKRRCPSCHRDMERINYCFDSNIFIDTCKTCKGVWLDAHEAPQIASYLSADDPRELAARALCEEVTQSERTHASLNVASSWFTVLFSIIPLPDPDELRLLPYAVLGLILANVLMMVAYTNADAEAARFFVTFGANCARLGQGRMLYTIFSHAFVHTNFFHIFGNLLFLLACGPIIENAVGHARFLMLYVLLAACALLPYYGQNITLVGASGAIAGLMGFTLAAFPLRRIHIINTFGAMELPALYVIGAWFLVQVLYSSFFHLAGSRADVGFDAHLAGFAAGLVLGLLHRHSRRAEPNRPAAA